MCIRDRLFNTKSVTQNSNGEVTGATIAIVANIKSGPILPVDALTIEATGKSRTAQSTIPVIKNLKFGEGNISEFGETRKLQVFGDIGATFDLDVVDSSGTSVLDVDDAVIVKTGNLDSGESVYEKDYVKVGTDENIGGNLKKHLKSLNKRMKESATNLEFEEAAKIRDEIRKLEASELEITLNPKVKKYSSNNKIYPKGRSTMGLPGTRAQKGKKKWKHTK